MSGARAGLAALDDAALEAAASKGLLRRAQRDREAGLAAIRAEDAETVTLGVDGETVTLRAGGLKAAACTCPAPSTCRHLLAAILLLRDAPTGEDGSPATEETEEPAVDPVAEIAALPAADLAKAFGRAALREAEAILATAAEVPDGIAFDTAQRACIIRLPGQPEVRYLAGLGLDGMISKRAAPGDGPGGSKLASTKALHAAALLAVRRLQAGERVEALAPEPDAKAPVPAVSGRFPQKDFLDAVEEALNEAGRCGLATAPLLMEERLLDLALSSRADALPRLSAALRGIAEDFSQRRARAALFEPDRALAAIAQACALVHALRRNGVDPALRGAVRQPYETLPSLDLIGCGVALWRTPTGAHGATAHCLSLSESGPRWFSASLARASGQDATFSPLFAARNEPVWGQTLAALGSRAFRLDEARATAEGRLSLGGETRFSWAPQGWAGLIERRPDLFVADWNGLRDRLFGLLSPSLRAPRAPAPVLLRPKAVAPVQFDALEQRAWLPVMDAAGAWLDLTIRSDGPDEARLDAVAALQAAGPPALIAALASREGSDLVLSPIAALPDLDGGFASFDLSTHHEKNAGSGTLLSRLKRGLSGLGERLRAEPAFARLPRPDAATAALLALASDHVLGLAELGGRMEDSSRLDRLVPLAERLEAAGLEPLSRLLFALARAEVSERPARLLAYVHAAACHAALATQPPLVRRLR